MAERSAITIDVDSLRFYRNIHGLERRSDESDPIYTVAMPRFFELTGALGLPSTLFLVGADAPRYAEAFRPVASLGAEIASHSFAHDYRLSQKTPADIREDLLRADAALRPLSTGTIRGFRAPGYNTSPALLRAVVELGYDYDSSLLPSPMYFGARALAIGVYRVIGRSSRSLIGDPRAYAGPLAPYRAAIDSPFRPAGDREAILELPMTCEPLTRIPLIGTSWVMLPTPARHAMLRSALRRVPVLNFEMHAIDLLDASDLSDHRDLAAVQRDLHVPVSRKMRAFGELFRALRDHAEVSTLETIATRC